MFKILFTIALTFSMMSQTYAADSKVAIKNAIDDFLYATNVEWDQKDKSFLRAQSLLLNERLKELEAMGATREEVISVGLSSLGNKKLENELRQNMELIKANNLSDEEAHKLLMSVVAKSGQSGASWDGAILAIGFIGLIFVALIASMFTNFGIKPGPGSDVRDYPAYCNGSNNEPVDCKLYY